MKRAPEIPAREGDVGFPGEIAGASLKPLAWAAREHIRIRDSPAKSPGPH